MKKQILIHPFLLTIYPIVTLFSRLPGGLEPSSIIRPVLLQLLLTVVVLFLFYWRHKNLLRAGLLTTFSVFYFSSTGYVYRSLQNTMWTDAPPSTHLAFVILGVLILFVVTQPIVWNKYLTKNRLLTINSYLNIVSVLALLYPLYQIGVTFYRAADDTKTPWSNLLNGGIAYQPLTANENPDIYYIILDGYSRADVLQKVYGFDNSSFIESLRERGFYIADQGHTNYIWTMLSLSSSLNMSYLNFATQAAGSQSNNILPLYDLIQHNQVRALLEHAGYSIVSVSTDYPFTDWQDADVYLYPYKGNPSELERFYLSFTALGAFYDPELPFTGFLRNLFPLPSYSTRRDRILYAFDQMEKIPEINGPKFVFIHVIAPHPPFVVDENGTALKSNKPYLPGDGQGSFESPEKYQQLYIEQLQFVNQKTLKGLDAILSDPTPKVVIVQGDHGGGSQLQPTVEGSCLFERTSILNAYYFSESQLSELYPSITPVNSFRVVFNTYFGTQYPLLPDRTYFSFIASPYNFIDTTDQIGTSCQ
jgi:hypothetical protein